MKSKKLISFLCAAAMTVSSFASLAVTASAADDSLFSNSFNGNTTGVFLDGTSAGSATDANNVVPGLTFVTGSRNGGDRGTYTDADGNTIYSGSYYAIVERATNDNALRLSFPQFGDFAGSPDKNGNPTGWRWAHVTLGDGTYAATATEDLVMDFDLKYTAGVIKGEEDTDYTPNLRIGTFDTNEHTETAVKIDSDSVGYDTWRKVRVVVNNSTGAKLYVDNAEVASAANSAVKALADIGLYSPEGTTNGSYATADYGDDYKDPDTPTTSPYAEVDNMVIYMAAADSVNGSTATKTPADVQGGQSTQEVIKPLEKVAGEAPCLVAPEDVQSLTTASFNNDNTFSEMVKASTTPFLLAGGKMTATIGTRDNGDDASTKVSLVNVVNGTKAVKLDGGKFSTGGRSPRLYPTDSLKVDEDGDETSVMGFSVYIGKSQADSKPGFWLIDTNEVNDEIVKSSDNDAKWGGKYDNSENAATNWKGVYAYFTTEEFEEGAYTFGGSKNRGITITPNEWHTVIVTVSSNGGYRVFVDDVKGDDNRLAPKVNDAVLSYGDGAWAPKNLPVISAENSATAKYTSVLIDNVVTYKLPEGAALESKYLPSVGEAPVETAPPTPTPKHNVTVAYANGTATVSTTEDTEFDAVAVVAKYDDENTLKEIVKIEPIKDLKVGADKTITGLELAEGDKVMVWDSVKGMIPYGSHAVTAAEANATKPTAAPKPSPTVAPSTDTPATDTPATDTPATDTPATNTPATDTPATNTPATQAPSTPTPEPTVPVLTEKTVMAQNDFSTDDVWGFSTGRTAPAVENGELVLTKGNNASDKSDNPMKSDVKTFNDAILTSADTEILFDYHPLVEADSNRWSSFSITGSDDKVIFSLASIGMKSSKDAGIGYTIGTRATTESNKLADGVTKLMDTVMTSSEEPKNKANKNTVRVYLHVAEGKVSGLIFDVTDGTPKFLAEVPETAIEATNVGKMVAQEGYSLSPQAIDNVLIVTNDADWTAPIPVTVTAPAAADGTLKADKSEVVAGNVITITPAAATGKKLKAVKVNDTAIEPTTETTGAGADAVTKTVYKYTVTAEDTAVAISAEFVRADVTAVTIASTNANVQKGYTGTYAATVKAGEVTLTGDDAKVTWGVKAAEGDGAVTACTATISDAGVLTVPDDHEEGKIVVTATITKDVTAEASAENTVVGTFDVTIIGEPNYQVVADSSIANGKVSFKVGENATANAVKESETLEIVPAPNKGYNTTKVEYIKTADLTAETPTWTEVTAAEGKYTVAGTALSGDITVKVTYTAIDYTITNSSATADAKGNKLEVDKTTANVGNTITITPTIAESTKMILSVKDAEDKDVAVTAGEGTYTFAMPASNVTISAQFVLVKQVELATAKIKGASVNFQTANDTNGITDGELGFGQIKTSNGAVDTTNKTYDTTSTVAIISADASEYAGKIYGAEITYDFRAADYNTWIRVFGKYANYIDMSATDASVTANNVNTLGGKATETYTFGEWVYGSTKSKTVTLTTPIDNIFVGDEDGKVTMYVGSGTGRLNWLNNIKIKLTVADETPAGE